MFRIFMCKYSLGHRGNCHWMQTLRAVAFTHCCMHCIVCHIIFLVISYYSDTDVCFAVEAVNMEDLLCRQHCWHWNVVGR